jgi:putative transposase
VSAAVELASEVGVAKACAAFDVARATVYRRLSARPKASRTGGARALSEAERTSVHEVLCSERFVDASPAEVHATLLDEGVHVASVSTMYRILRAKRSVRERRAVRRHPSYARPELVARAPNQVWTWDITKVRGPGRRDWYHLYVIIDLYSRYVVGWLLAAHESGALAERFIAETMSTHGVQPGELTLHSDRGVSMRSKTVAEMLADMGVVRSHSRPRTSNDNPFSEAQFKTMKYCPFFPGSFASVDEGRQYFTLFVGWYNNEHHHSGIAMLTPAVVFGGTVDQVVAAHQVAMDASFARHPERFVRGRPIVARPDAEVWINRPERQLPVASDEPPNASANPEATPDPVQVLP